MRQGKGERAGKGRGSSQFEDTLGEQENSEVKKLGIALVAMFGIIFASLAAQIAAL